MRQKETASEYRRRRAIELMEQGEPVSLIAQFLGVSRGSVYYWNKRYQSGKSLETSPRSGRPRKLTNDRLDTLRELLLQGATAHGWQNDLWTAKRVAEIIRKHFSIECSPETIRRTLRNRLGWTPQRPTQQENERDETEIQHWREVTFPQIVRNAFATGAYLVFVDEAGFMASPTRRLTYAPRGKTPVIKVTNAHGRISIAGAITVSPQRRHLGFLYQALPDNRNFYGNTIVQFLKNICQHIRGPIILLWDGCSIHLSEAVSQFLERHSEIQVEPFPAYAHELNPVDKAWCYVKYDCLPNYAPKTLGELRCRLVQEFDELRTKTKVLAWCIEQTGLKTRLAPKTT